MSRSACPLRSNFTLIRPPAQPGLRAATPERSSEHDRKEPVSTQDHQQFRCYRIRGYGADVNPYIACRRSPVAHRSRLGRGQGFRTATCCRGLRLYTLSHPIRQRKIRALPPPCRRETSLRPKARCLPAVTGGTRPTEGQNGVATLYARPFGLSRDSCYSGFYF